MNESEFENELRGLRPVSPSHSLQCRIASALPHAKKRRSTWGVWLVERMFWAAGGAFAVWLLVSRSVTSTAPSLDATPTQASSASRVSEEPLAWSDEGVQLVDSGSPARMLRRLVMERHRSADGSPEVRVPREDVILLPVTLR
ncbi:MAG: hypothetical protein K8R87_13225 [Verrucomicrobia bacterium]|nr:hypothetical protein [Verrucomicrobiota bacterium]